MKVIPHANKALALVGNTPSVSRHAMIAGLTMFFAMPSSRSVGLTQIKEFHWIPPCVAFNIPCFLLASTLGPVDGLALMGLQAGLLPASTLGPEDGLVL